MRAEVGCLFAQTAWPIVSCAMAAGRTAECLGSVEEAECIILRADSIGSPAVLMRFGNARLRELEAHGIPLAIELLGVGARALEHAALPSGWCLTRADAGSGAIRASGLWRALLPRGLHKPTTCNSS